MDLKHLEDHFAIPGVLAFNESPSGLVYAEITSTAAKARVFLQGAHVAHWQPAGQKPVIFLSRKSEMAPGKAIRGGVPIAFPWFANRTDGKTGPNHGFARIQDWTMQSAAMAGDDLHLAFTLGPSELSRSLGFDHFRLAFQLTIGRSLTMQLTVANDARTPLVFEEALHTYYSIVDIHEISIDGLDGVHYIDKVDGLKEKVQHGPIHITAQTDRVYLNTTSTCTIHDEAGKRSITVAKKNSNTTVVWNPWEDGILKVPDLDPSEWHEYVAVETVNANVDRVHLDPGKAHTMQAHITVADTTA